MRLTESLKPANVKSEWFIVDATDLTLGRMSSEIASRLKGKHKADVTPHVDNGDSIIVINAERVKLTGNKLNDLIHHWHTNHPGGIRSINAKTELEGRHPERIVQRAIRRMMPKTKLGRTMLGKLHVYAGEVHPHEAQQPKTLDVGKIIAKATKK